MSMHKSPAAREIALERRMAERERMTQRSSARADKYTRLAWQGITEGRTVIMAGAMPNRNAFRGGL